MDHDTALHPAPRPLQCGCGVALRRFTITGTGTTRHIQATPAGGAADPPAGLVAWALSPAALEDWCAGRPPLHDIVDDQGRLLRRRDHAPPPGTRYTCAACDATDQPYLSDDAVCAVCAAYVPLVLEFTGYAGCDTPGSWTPQGPRPTQQLNAVLLDYDLPPAAVIHLLPGVTTCSAGIERSSLIALLSVRRHIARHILHQLAQEAG